MHLFFLSIFLMVIFIWIYNGIVKTVDYHGHINSTLKKERELFLYDPDQQAYFDRKTGKRVSDGERVRRMESSITEY